MTHASATVENLKENSPYTETTVAMKRILQQKKRNTKIERNLNFSSTMILSVISNANTLSQYDSYHGKKLRTLICLHHNSQNVLISFCSVPFITSFCTSHFHTCLIVRITLVSWDKFKNFNVTSFVTFSTLISWWEYPKDSSVEFSNFRPSYGNLMLTAASSNRDRFVQVKCSASWLFF